MVAGNSTGDLNAWATVPIVVLVVLVAGCSGGGSTGTSTPGTATDAPTTEPAGTLAPEPTTERRTTRRTTTPKAVDNPWGRTPVVVGVENDADGRNYTPQVRAAVEYWRTNGSAYATWDPAFVVRPDASDPDVVVRFKREVTLCGLTVEPGASYLGCAAVLGPDDRPRSPETVAVRGGLTNESTYRTVRHELGHVLGLDHGDPPADVMNESDVVAQRIYAVHVDASRLSIRGDTTIRQTKHVFGYYEGGAEGWLEEDVRFELVEEEHRADVTVVVTKDSPPGSTVDPETGTIYLDGLPPTRHGWHVGYWLGFFLGAESVDDLPPAFDEPRVDDREDWW